METENEIVEVKPIVYIPSLPDIQIGVETGTGRSNWQNVSSQGRLCRKQQWRWYGRLGPSNVRPLVKKQWRSLG